MSYAQAGIATSGTPAVNLQPVPAAPLLNSLNARLSAAHEIVTRLENLADRVFGPTPQPGEKALPMESSADVVNNSVSSLVDRLHAVANRLDQIA